LCPSPFLVYPRFSDKNNINPPLFTPFQKHMCTLTLPCYVLVSHAEALRRGVFLVLVVRPGTSLTSLEVSVRWDRSDPVSTLQRHRPTPPRFLRWRVLGWHLRLSSVTADLQGGSVPPTNAGRFDADPALLYIYTYPVSSCWLFEQCSKFNPHPYVHSVRPEFGDHDIALSISPNSQYSDSIPMVTGSPLTLHCSKKETGHIPPHGLSLSLSTMSESTSPA